MPHGSDVLDRTFRALSDPGRRTMLDRLGHGPASVSELAAPLPMSLAAVVQHVQLLEASGLLRTEKVGRVRTCSVRPEALGTAEQWLAQQRTEWERRLDRLGVVLADLGPSTSTDPGR